MPFTFYNPPTLTPEQTNPFNAAITTALQRMQDIPNAMYLPQKIKADIFNKQFSPLAQIASSPLALAMLPDQQKQMADLISKLLQQQGVGGSNLLGGGGSASGGIPQSGQPGSISSVPSGSNNQPSSQGSTSNPLLPPGNDLRSGVTAKTTGQYHEQIHPPGSLYQSGNESYSTPTGSQVDQAQQTFTAYNNIKDLIPNLLKESKEFENKGWDIKRARIARFLQSHHAGPIGNAISSDPDLAGRWNNFNQDLNRAGIVLQKIFPASQSQESYNQHMSMLSFDPNVDTFKTYQKRLNKLLSDSLIAYKNAQKQAGNTGGFNLTKKPGKFSIGPEKTKTIGNQEYHLIKGKWLPVLGE